MLEEYTILREEKEQERRRQRDLKKLQGQLIAEQEALYGSKPSPSKPQTAKKAPRMSTGGAASRRVSLGGAMVQTPKATHSRPMRKTDIAHHIDNHLDDSVSSLSSGNFLKCQSSFVFFFFFTSFLVLCLFKFRGRKFLTL